MDKKPRKKTFRKGMELFNNETKEKVMFAKWTAEATASCLVMKTKTFISVPREELENNYTSYAELDRKYREKRSGEAW